MKNLLLLSVVLCLFSCINRNQVNKVEIIYIDTISTAQIEIDFEKLQAIEDSLKCEKIKTDSLYRIFKRDSLYKSFQQDSINFRKITRIINGGFNGWDDRYRLWLIGRKEFDLFAPH